MAVDLELAGSWMRLQLKIWMLERNIYLDVIAGLLLMKVINN